MISDKAAKFFPLALFTFIGQAGYWEIRDLGIYRPLYSDLVAAPASDELIVLDIAETTIFLIRESGERKAFGGKGQGPGELNIPQAVFSDEDHIYVRDFGVIHVFDRRGVFQKRLRTPENFALFKCVDGWLGHTLQTLGEGVFEVVWWNGSLERSERLLSWPMGEFRRDVPLSLADQSRVRVSPDGHWAVARQEGTAKVHILNLKSKKTDSVLQPEFPREKVSQNLIESSENARREFYRRTGAPFEPLDYPEYIPPVLSVNMDLDNRIVVSRLPASGAVEGAAFAMNGEEIPMEKVASGGLAAYGDWVFVGVYDSEQGAGVVRVPRAEARQFAQDNPPDLESAFR